LVVFEKRHAGRIRLALIAREIDLQHLTTLERADVKEKVTSDTHD